MGARDHGSLAPVVLFGDSITQWSMFAEGKGLVEVFEQRYKGRAEVWNEGHAGYTTTMLMPGFTRVRNALHQHIQAPLLFTICLGANDACLMAPRDIKNTKTLVSLELFIKTIEIWVETLLEDTKLEGLKILLITPPPIDASRGDLEDGADWEQEVAEAKTGAGWRTYNSKRIFADAIMELATRFEQSHPDRVTGCDVWRGMINAAIQHDWKTGAPAQEMLPPWPGKIQWDQAERCVLPGSAIPAKSDGATVQFPDGWFSDGLHLNPAGYAIFTGEIVKKLDDKWPGLVPSGQ